MVSLPIYPDESWEQKQPECRNTAAFAHSSESYYDHKEDAVSQLRGYIIRSTFFMVSPVYHISINKPARVDYNNNEHCKEQPKILLSELLYLHELVKGHD